jgi:SAM-dependent methyltransferase
MASVSGDAQPRRYQSAAVHYLAGRPPYADRLIRRVAWWVGLTRQDRVLDLGCGPGPLARTFVPLAGEVVGMDPSPEMLGVAEVLGGGIRYVPGGSEDLGPSMGRFHLVVMGRSFHWMDRAETLRRLDGMIEPHGAIALFHAEHARAPDNAWVERYNELRRRYTGSESRHRGPGWVRHEAFLLDSPFCCVESCSAFERRTFDAATLVDRAFSVSSSEPARLGERAEDLRRDIEALIGEIAPDGRLTEVIESSALIACRPNEGTLP